MSDGYPRRKSFSNKRFKDVISEGLYLFSRSYKTLIIPLALIFVISLIIKNLLVTDLNWQLNLITPAIELIIQKDPTSLTNDDLNVMFEYFALIINTEFFNNLTSSIFNVFAMCLVSNYLFTKFSGIPSNFSTELKNAFNWRLLLVILLLGVGVALGSFLLFIPSIIIYGYYIFYIFTYHSEEGIQPIKEAREIARGAFWKIIGIFILSNLIIFKMPFSVPDPILKYKASLSKNGFLEVYLPEMVIKLRQGLGRLIRKETDKGIVTILDSRISSVQNTTYRKTVLEAIPFKNVTEDFQEVEKFVNDVLKF